MITAVGGGLLLSWLTTMHMGAGRRLQLGGCGGGGTGCVCGGGGVAIPLHVMLKWLIRTQ